MKPCTLAIPSPERWTKAEHGPPFNTNIVPFLCHQATVYISFTPSQPLLASPTHTILIPVLGGIRSCPQGGQDISNSSPPPLAGPLSQPRTNQGWSRLPLHRSTRFRGSTTRSSLPTVGAVGGAHVGLVMLHHSRSYTYCLQQAPQSLKHKLSHPTITHNTTLLSFLDQRAIVPAFLQTSKTV